MRTDRLPMIVALLASLGIGTAAGVGGFTFVAAHGGAYLSDDPAVCVNCHIMREQFDGWQHGSHHAVAVCNDCHLPHENLAGKLYVKAEQRLPPLAGLHAPGLRRADPHQARQRRGAGSQLPALPRRDRSRRSPRTARSGCRQTPRAAPTSTAASSATRRWAMGRVASSRSHRSNRRIPDMTAGKRSPHDRRQAGPRRPGRRPRQRVAAPALREHLDAQAGGEADLPAARGAGRDDGRPRRLGQELPAPVRRLPAHGRAQRHAASAAGGARPCPTAASSRTRAW